MAEIMEKEYIPIPRKYRPHRFSDVVGQEPIVKTIKNGLKNGKVANAYLFCGSRGTGKTTLARLLAAALNCTSLNTDSEPCGKCPSCTDLLLGRSVDILEIDGASNRGIDDIRQLNETTLYAAPNGRYKIYIIDEVHMLTKEAFNALLKTIEEPPARVKFFFATTESNKVPVTISSRCQRFDLARISTCAICETLTKITADLGLQAEPAALRLIASVSEGALRDAEALLDQMLCFSSGKVTEEDVGAALGLAPQELLFDLDRAIDKSELSFALTLTSNLFTKGYDLALFHERLTSHFRTHLHIQLTGSPPGDSDPAHGPTYLELSPSYTREQCLYILDTLISTQSSGSAFARVQLEMLLLTLLRSKHRLPLDAIAARLIALENKKEIVRAEPPAKPAQIETPIEHDFIAKIEAKIAAAPKQVAPPIVKKEEEKKPDPLPQREESPRDETLLRFAAAILEGSVKK